jgi:hypothetical protein
MPIIARCRKNQGCKRIESSRTSRREGMKNRSRNFFSLGFQIKVIAERNIRKMKNVFIEELNFIGKNEKYGINGKSLSPGIHNSLVMKNWRKKVRRTSPADRFIFFSMDKVDFLVKYTKKIIKFK